MKPRLYLHKPEVIFRALINQSNFTFPLIQLTYDNVTLGAIEDVKPGMTMVLSSSLNAGDRGRQRIRKAGDSTTLFVGRSSQGVRDGELNPANDMIVEVWNDRRVWAKIPVMPLFDEEILILKDGDIEVGDNTTNPPPIANLGSGFAGTIDPISGVATVDFFSNNSWAVAEGATISSVLWDAADGTYTFGDATAEVITLTFPPGYREVSLTVTDSNGKSHTAYAPVYVRDPQADTSIQAFEISSHRIAPEGQEMSVVIREEIAEGEYPDGTLAMVWDDEVSPSADREGMIFIGWHDSDPAQMQGTRVGLERDVTLNLVDVGGKLRSLPAFPQVIETEAIRDEEAFPEITWMQMVSPTIKKYIHYLLHWHSTALEVADLRFLGTTFETDYPFIILESSGGTLWDQVEQRLKQLTPDHLLTCNRRGQLAVWPDPFLLDSGDRTELFQGEITNDLWSEISYTNRNSSRVYWLKGGAILAQSAPTFVNGELNFPLVFCVAPGEAPGQGSNEQQEYERLALSQSDLNKTIGHKYARLNAPQEFFSVLLAGSGDLGLEPADLEWVYLNISPQEAAQRGLYFGTEEFRDRGLVHEINIQYDHRKTGLLGRVRLNWERETLGIPAVTTIPPVSTTDPGTGLPDDFFDNNPGEVEIPSPGLFYGDMKAYLLWSTTQVFRTWNIQDASPTWEEVGPTLASHIIDIQYVHVSGSQVGVWLLTSEEVFWCADIMETTPSWSLVHDIATVRAAEVQLPSNPSVFRSMANYASEPGYLIVATSPKASPAFAENYPHAYSWHTHDYGANWTMVDMDGYTFTNSGIVRGYCNVGWFGTEIFRSPPGTIYMCRHAFRVGLQGRTAVFISSDLGDTWTKGFEVEAASDFESGSILHPFPDSDSPAYLVRQNSASANYANLYKTTDGWLNATQVTTLPASPYDHPSDVYRVNKHTDDPNHLIFWFRNTSGSPARLFESYDAGATWQDLGLEKVGEATGSRSTWSEPNGWPPDPDQWVIVYTLSDAFVGGEANVVELTLDNFATMQDKSGNLPSIVSSWDADSIEGQAGGFALPRVGANA